MEITNDEYAEIGRVVVSAARLEHTLAATAGFLDRVLNAQDEETAINKFWKQTAGNQASALYTKCETLINSLPQSSLAPARRDEVLALLATAKRLLDARNAVAHGMWWERTDDGGLVSTRPNRDKKVPGTGVDHLLKRPFPKGNMAALADSLDRLTLQLGAFIQEIRQGPWRSGKQGSD